MQAVEEIGAYDRTPQKEDQEEPEENLEDNSADIFDTDIERQMEELGFGKAGSQEYDTVKCDMPGVVMEPESKAQDELLQHEKQSNESEQNESLEGADPQEALDQDADGLGELGNKEFQPFRDEAQRDHINAHVMRELTGSRTRSSDSSCSTATVRTVDPDLIKAKVKRQLKGQQQKQQARRIRKSGEAALTTKHRRENADNIKQSVSAEWY